MSVTVGWRDGRAVVIKTSVRRPQRLQREAEVLAALRHPRVVEFVEFADAASAEPAELVTAHAGSLTLATCPPLPVAAGVLTLAAVAAAVADIHDAGWVHGRLTPDHVILDHRREPVLCGFAEAAPRQDDAHAAGDVAALGRLIDHVVTGVGGDIGQPIPDRRWHSAQTAARRSTAERRALLALADHAAADDRTCRPRARELAAALSGLAGPAPARFPGRVALAAAAGLGLIAFGAAAFREPGPAATPPVAGPTSASPPSTTAATATTTTSSVGSDIDGLTLTKGDRRWRVGAPGDQPVIGDWDCDGEPTPVAPATGNR